MSRLVFLFITGLFHSLAEYNGFILIAWEFFILSFSLVYVLYCVCENRTDFYSDIPIFFSTLFPLLLSFYSLLLSFNFQLLFSFSFSSPHSSFSPFLSPCILPHSFVDYLIKHFPHLSFTRQYNSVKWPVHVDNTLIPDIVLLITTCPN